MLRQRTNRRDGFNRKSCVYYRPTVDGLATGYIAIGIPLTFMFYVYYRLYQLTRTPICTFNHSVSPMTSTGTRHGSAASGTGHKVLNGSDPKTQLKSILKQPSTATAKRPETSTVTLSIITGPRDVSNHTQLRASIMIGMIIATYCVCIFPPTIVYFLYFYCPSCESIVHTSPVIYMYPWMCFINSAIDPFIFVLMNKDMRKFVLRNIISLNCICTWTRRHN